MENKKKRIALMTWYTYRNYGTALQMSALYHTLQPLCDEVKLIDYIPKKAPDIAGGKAFWKKVFRRAKSMLTGGFYHPLERETLYEKYIADRVMLTEPCRSYSELYALNEQFDAFVCGSDQIWSPFSYDEKYFLPFVKDAEKLIAYAPSMGSRAVQSDVLKEKIRRDVSRFRYLSVREKQGAETIERLTGRQAKVVLDPTMLLSGEEWTAFAAVEHTQKIDGEYILCYFLGDEKKYDSSVREMTKRTGLPVYTIPVTKRQYKNGGAVPFEVGPSEFVSLIKNAKYVCTDSFHGMVFAINFNVPFLAFKRFSDRDTDSQNSRVYNLLEGLRLSDRLVEGGGNIERFLSCDYAEANGLLDVLRKQSKDFLMGAVEGCFASLKSSDDGGRYEITDVCCGCGGCAAVCPKGAIQMEKDGEGFWRYSIDKSKCVRCGLCKKVCPMLAVTANRVQNAHALYCVKSTDEAVLKNSSSGGAAYELGKKAALEGRSICGCVYNPSKNAAEHILLQSGEERELRRLQGSKYIQSYSADALKEIYAADERQKIVFFGTPCQVAAVDKLLSRKGKREEALLVDLICHGVPSDLLWQKYLREMDKKHGTGAHPSVNFRSKENGWKNRTIVVKGEKRTYKKTQGKDDFYAFFRRGFCHMGACFECPYRERSAADIRLGDYWGERFEEEKQGVSMVIANTDLGELAITALSKDGRCNVQRFDLDEYWKEQAPYNHQPPQFRGELLNTLKDDGCNLHALRKKYCKYEDLIEWARGAHRKIKRLKK